MGTQLVRRGGVATTLPGDVHAIQFSTSLNYFRRVNTFHDVLLSCLLGVPWGESVEWEECQSDVLRRCDYPEKGNEKRVTYERVKGLGHGSWRKERIVAILSLRE